MDAAWNGGSAGSRDEAIRRDWRLLHEKVYKTRITDLDDLKHRIKTEWAKLDHAIIAAAVHQWRRLFQLVSRRVVVISSTAFNSDI